MTYIVKEIYYTLQGEGANTGRAAVFCRFAGCNLWSGRDEDRATSKCRFCDTDFVGTDGPGGGRFETPEAVLAIAAAAWERGTGKWPALDPSVAEAKPLVVCTGGEPLLQLDDALIGAFHRAGFAVAIESNGTLHAPLGIDWICVSPKAGVALNQTTGDELKLVYPQEGAGPEDFEHLEFRYFFLQPLDGPERERNIAATLDYCLKHPRWRLSVQTHKYLNIP